MTVDRSGGEDDIFRVLDVLNWSDDSMTHRPVRVLRQGIQRQLQS